MNKIMEFIEDEQKGRSGIYPYKIAQEVAIKFRIPIKEASKYVLQHIKNEIREASE